MECMNKLFRFFFRDITEVVIIGLEDLPDHWHCEDDYKANRCPNSNRVIAIHWALLIGGMTLALISGE